MSVVINTDVNCNLKAEIVDQFCLIFFSDTNELIWNRIYNIHDPLYYENALANLEMWCLPLVSLILETSDQLPAFDEFEEYDDSSISKRKLLELKKAKHSLFLKCVSFINQLSLRFENNIGEEISIKFIQNLTSSLEDKGLMVIIIKLVMIKF